MAIATRPDLDYIETGLRVRYAETDQMGVVHNANYFIWFEVGRLAWCHAKGFSYKEMEVDADHYLMVAESNCRFRMPAHFEDEIVVRTACSTATDRVIRFTYEVLNKNTAQLLATGETAHVVTDRDYRPSRMPDKYRPYFSLPPRRPPCG